MVDVSGGERPPEGAGRGKPILKLVLLGLLILAGLLVARLTPAGAYLSTDGVGRAIEWLRGAPLAPLIFVAAYALATALAVPGTVLTLAGGALFGVFWGTVYNSIAANIGANAAFGIARFLGREGVEKLTGDRLDKLDRAAREHGLRGLLTLRLIPLVPFNALNFGSGLTAMSWGTYALATVIGILPGTIVYTMFADALLAGSQEASREALLRVVISGGLLIFLSFLPTILKKMHIDLPGTSKLLALFLVPPCLALGPTDGRAQASDPFPPDPTPFTELLADVVLGDRVDYERLQDERARLDGYLETLAEVRPAQLRGAASEARLAFWINAYNACMLKRVVDHYPIESSTGFFGRIRNAFADRPDNSVWQIDDVFTGEHCRVAGEDRSQDEIEHEIIRPMGDPRIHFAVNCAAVSCPRLAEEAYVGPRIDEQLDRQVRSFIADPRHFVLEGGEEPVLRLNKVLEWYAEDFGGEEGLPDFFLPYVDAPRRPLLSGEDLEVEFFEYDWTLNDVEG